MRTAKRSGVAQLSRRRRGCLSNPRTTDFHVPTVRGWPCSHECLSLQCARNLRVKTHAARTLLHPSLCRLYTHKHFTYSAVQLVHKRGTNRTGLAQGSSHKNCSVICCALDKSLSSGQHMSHPLLLSHLPCTTSTSSSSTSSSSFALLSTTTPEHALHSGQHDLLQEHPVHHKLLRARPVEKDRYQEPLWRENMQSDGNLRNTFSTGYEPKELATKELATKELAVVSTISRVTDPYQLHDAQKEFGEEDHRARTPKKWRYLARLERLACRILKYQRRLTFRHRCFSTIPWKALQILISKVESYKRY